MSAQITDVAAALGVEPADIIAIVTQLADIDADDTVDANREAAPDDVIDCPDGIYANVWLTPSAIASLYYTFDGSPVLALERFGIRLAPQA